MRISVCIIAKNEEEMIGGLLESVKEADEIVVSQNDSTDKTVEIAESYGAKVYNDYKWIDDFSDARNYALSKCTGDWVLAIDCDNRLEPGGISKIKDIIQTTPYEVLDVTWHTGEHRHRLPWLFKRKPEHYFSGAAHEYLSAFPQGDSGIKIEELTSISHSKDPDRTSRILGKSLEKNPGLVRERFYYAREFYYRKDYAGAVAEFDKYLAVATWMPEIVEAQYLKALCLWNNNQGNEARETALEALKNDPLCKKVLLLLSDLYFEPWKSKWRILSGSATDQDTLFT